MKKTFITILTVVTLLDGSACLPASARGTTRDFDQPWGGFTPLQKIGPSSPEMPWWGPSRSSQAVEYPELRSQLYQGDILLPDHDSRNAIRVKKYLWNNAVIPYRFAPGNFSILRLDDVIWKSLSHSQANLKIPTNPSLVHLADQMKKTVVEAMQVIENRTCVKFVDYEAQAEHVEIRSLPQRGCYAVVGRRPGKKILPMNLQYPECFHSRGIIEHELLHVVGLLHEQARKDRDEHVTVHWDNIDQTYWGEFSKMRSNEVSTFDLPYDYKSIMHYPNWAFSKNGKPTITAKGHPKMELGQRNGPTHSDIQKVRRMYNCSNY